MTVRDHPQAGRGWAFPPRWQPRDADGPLTAVMNDGAPHVEEAMLVLLRTMPGSRVMRPELGAGIEQHVFEPRTASACHRLGEDVRRTLVLGEPRVIVDSVEAVPAGDTEDRVDVTIAYRIDRHRRPSNLVVPFYSAATS
jgi:uncharacterized protein